MFDFIEALIRKQVSKVENHHGSELLCGQVLSRFSEALHGLAMTVSQSTVTQMLVRQVGDSNPLAYLDPALLTDEQRSTAEKAVNEALISGTLSFPKPLTDILELRLQIVTEAFMEMIERLSAHREELGSMLPGGKTFTRIEDIALSAGDTHNMGRSVAILYTDAGRFVYKPRDMRGEASVFELVRNHFSDVLGVPECIAFGRSFGVCEYIEKHRLEGTEDAHAFWHRMGGASAVMKILGSTDMHVENLICADGKPYIIDLETVISPGLSNEAYEMLHPELSHLKSTSPYLSGILPNRHEDRELSVLMSIADEGCAPVINGKRITVRDCKTDFIAGYAEIYRRILEHKSDISHFASALSPEIPVRILIRNTQFYHENMLRLYHHSSLSDEEAQDRARSRLKKNLSRNIRPEFECAVQSEILQLERGDIPYFYTYADSGNLYSGGEVIVESVFEHSAERHILDNLEALSDKDLSFDIQLLERSISQYPQILPEEEREKPCRPVRTDEPLPRCQAIAEAKRQLELAFDLSIKAPDGKLFWGYISDPDGSFRFCETGLSNGLTGIAVFSAAYAYATGEERAEKLASLAVHEAVTELERFYSYYERSGFPEDQTPNPGESDGMGGILNGLALLRRYVGGSKMEKLQEKALLLLSEFGSSRYSTPDRMIGISGLLSVLCRFDEYRVHTELIETAAEKLLSMQTLPYKGKLLWKPFYDKNRPISGGGHGLAGIAEALFAAGAILEKEEYLRAAEEAILFELDAYNVKLHTWSDLRTYPPVGYMHGYCSGAPGIGIMAERIRKTGYSSKELEKCATLAAQSIDGLPLNERDHLCCGNSAVAEYYMTVGRFDDAGRILSAMRNRSIGTGSYRYMGYSCHNGVSASLFYGVCGIGYEMLRYACPEKIISVI